MSVLVVLMGNSRSIQEALDHLTIHHHGYLIKRAEHRQLRRYYVILTDERLYLYVTLPYFKHRMEFYLFSSMERYEDQSCTTMVDWIELQQFVDVQVHRRRALQIGNPFCNFLPLLNQK